MSSNPSRHCQFWTDVYESVDFPTSLLDLLKIDGQLARSLYSSMNFPRGFLFENFDGLFSTPKGNRLLCMYGDDRQIYDMALKKYVPFTKELFESIPPTFTFAFKPVNDETEVEYFVRSAALPKHAFVWSNHVNQLSPDLYASIRGNKNKEFRGRYTLTPNLPQISNLGKWEHDNYGNGRYVIDQNEYEMLFTA